MSQQIRKQLWPLVAVIAALYLAYDAGSQQQLVTGGVGFFPGPLRIQYIPAPTDIVNLAEGTPYVVPAGKVFIITDWVTTDAQALNNTNALNVAVQPRIYVDGVATWGGGYAMSRTVTGQTGAQASTGAATLFGALRSGIRANAGSTVTLATVVASDGSPVVGAPLTFASGYLAADT